MQCDQIDQYAPVGQRASVLNALDRCGDAGELASLKKIAVFRALQLGDMLCAVPALRSLRMAVPNAEIVLIGLPWAEAFAARFSRYIDRFIAFPGFPGLPERRPALEELPRFLASVQEERFDLAIQLHGSGALTNPLVAAFRASRHAGFALPGQAIQPDLPFSWRDDEHEIFRLLDLMEQLGAESCGAMLEFQIEPEDVARAKEVGPDLLPGGYVCIHPGAQLASRRWPPERFAAVGERLHAAGYRIVVTGTIQEQALTASVCQAMRSPAIDLAGKTDLGSLAALVAGARLVVCNDTGISHVATAVGAPSVVVSSGADIRRWAPLNRLRHRTLAADVPCRPCMEAVCPVSGHPCASGITVDDVVDEAMTLLGDEAARIGQPIQRTPSRRAGHAGKAKGWATL